MIGRDQKVIATKQTDLKVQRFVNSNDAERLAEMGTSCPDHFLRTKIKPLYVDWNPQEENVEELKVKLQAGLEQYRQDYSAYYDACERSDSPPMRNPNPTVILIPGVLPVPNNQRDSNGVLKIRTRHHVFYSVLTGIQHLN